MIAIEVDDVKVARPIIVILRWLDHLCSAFCKFGENTVDIPHGLLATRRVFTTNGVAADNSRCAQAYC
jgi:hypothetical protein